MRKFFTDMKSLSFSALVISVIAITASVISCEYTPGKVRQIEAERDSLAAVMAQRDAAADEMNVFIETISSSLDSIRIAEKLITVDVDDNGEQLRTDAIKNNLHLMEDLIKRQRTRIAELERKIKSNERDAAKYKVIIANLNAQLDEKDAQIRQMKKELDSKDKTITDLNSNIASLNTSLANAEERNREQNELIEKQSSRLLSQDKIANTGYIIAGTKKDLQKMGILGTGFKSGKIDYAGIDASKYHRVDIREFSEMQLDSRNPKILSGMPSDSYTIEKGESECTLRISDPVRFWSVTPFLIIQL